MKDKINKLLDTIRPSLQADGGDIELMDFDEEKGIVKVKLMGACRGCPLSAITLKETVEKYLKSEIPEIKEVIEA